MKTIGKMVAALGLVGLMAAPAMAQGRGGFGGGFGGPGMLLSNKGVQQELKVSDEQAKKLDTLAEETRSKSRENMAKLKDATKDERQEKMRTLGAETNAEVNKSLVEILKPEQIQRFHQIQTQAAGVNAFSTPHVQKALSLTDDQKTKIHAINEETMQAAREARTSAGDDREAAMKKVTELRKDALSKVTALLTDDQKASWTKLIGDPYEVKFERRPNN